MKNGDPNFQHLTGDVKKYLNPKVGIALIVLIVFQYGFSGSFFSAIGMDYMHFLYLDAVSSYAMIVLSVVFFSPNALELFRDHFTLWIIVLSSFLPIIFGGENTIIYKAIFVILGLILAAYTTVNRKNIKFPGLKSVLIGLIWSVSAVSILVLIYAILDQTYTKSFPPNLLAIIFSSFIYQLSFVSVVEEAHFRGLIFSFMVMNGYKEDKAFIVQAFLFWIIHFGDAITKPVLFFVIIPLSTLFLTLIIKKYKMLYLSIMMHTFINVFTTILVALINTYLF